MLKVEEHNKAFVRKICMMLIAILLFKITGYFTLSENITVTRILKVLIRLSMTGWVWLIYRELKRRGNVAVFQYEHVMAPFFFGMYYFLGLVSLLYSTNPGYSALQLSMNLESFLFAYLFLKVYILLKHYYPESPVRLSALLAPAVFGVLFLFVVGMWIDPDTFYRLTHGGEEARLGGILMNPNELGMLAVVGMGAAFVELSQKSKRIWEYLMILFMLYALVLTGSRSSMIGFMLIVLIYIKKNNNTKLKLAVLVGMVISIPLIVNTIFLKQGDLEEVLSMTGRLPFWKALLTEGLPKEPFFGFGYMRIAYTDAFQSVHTYAGKMTHNTFIQVLMNLGFVGFTTVIIQMVFTIRAYVKSVNASHKYLFIAVFIPILINSFTEFGIFGEANFGVLFYQLLVWLFVLKVSPHLTVYQKHYLQLKRPEFELEKYGKNEIKSI